jgi:UDP-glucose 4-epimerase
MCYQLRDRGEAVVALDNLSTGQAWLVPKDVPLFVGDIANEDLVFSILAAHSVDTILHFAASIVVPESVAHPVDYYHNNTGGSCALLRAASRAGIRFIVFSSTAAVYGEPEACPVPEDAPTLPTSPYGSSKLMTEIMLRDLAAASSLKYACLRYFNVAGADPQLRTGESPHEATHLIKVAAQAALGIRPHLTLYGQNYPTQDGTCVRDYVHVSDLAAAHSAALDYLRQGGASTVMNCGYGHGYSVREVVEAVKKVSGSDFPIHQAERRPGDPAQIVAGVARIRRMLEWRPSFDDLDTIVGHALAWERRLLQCAART